MADNNENKVLNVPHLRFPEFTEEWEETTLGKISEITKGSGISKDQLSEQGSPCILYGELYTKYKSEIIDEVYSRTELDSSSLVKSKANDVIIPCSGETAIDISTARCVPFNNILLGGDLNIIRLKHDDGGFFAYQLNGARKKDIARVAQGVSVVHLYGENLKHIRVYHPAIEEQKKITRLLSLIDERIATQNKIIEKLQSLIKGLIDDIITLKCGQLVAFETLYSKAGEGGTPTTSNTEFYDNGSIPFIKIDDLSNKYLSANKDYITELGLKKSSAWLIPTHSIIYSNGATIGAISINKYPVCTKQGILGIVPNTNIDVEFLYYFMQSSYFQKEVERVVTEGTMKTAYLKDINHIKCPIPDLDRQKEISHLLSVLSLKEDVERQLLQKYQIQKQYLLRKMFI
ncbi:restriction endonuclease subunit S [Phocaeicola vulgatus]|nr:restriction endonuclease subunit S [Phocaeicola vulgatus]MDC7188347.1 restriction endonuclease subunit S [Phocaeicola vulgatus]